MRSIYTLIIAGFIGCAGFTVYAQSPTDLDAMIRSLTTGGNSGTDDIMSGLTETLTPAGPQVSIIDAPLTIDTDVPEVNQTFAPAYIGNSQTGRYPPRLKIDFTEFPLRSLAQANRLGLAQTEVLSKRIQSRLSVSQPIHVVVKDRTAIVSGTVATERQRDIAAAMLRFEPGIDTVQNKITVAPQ